MLSQVIFAATTSAKSCASAFILSIDCRQGTMALRNVATQLRLARSGQQVRCFSASAQQLQARLAVLGAGQMV
jgi:hypothetical protein